MLHLKIHEIKNCLDTNWETSHNVGLYSDLAGISLFYFIYAKQFNDNSAAQNGLEVILNAIDIIKYRKTQPSYCSGVAGLFWMIEFLQENDLAEIYSDESLLDLECQLYDEMSKEIKSKNYDLFYGVLGYGMYFLKRYKNSPNNHVYKRYLVEIIDFLYLVSEKESNQYKWIMYFDKEKIKKYNLGLGHGISSIISFLSKLYEYDDFKNKVSPLIKGGMNFIISNMNSYEAPVLFPNLIYLGKNIKYDSKLAWCHGDLGIGLTLWNVSKRLNDKKHLNLALEILIHTTNRKYNERNNFFENGICHGFFGLVQIFNKMYKETNEELFKQTTEYWINIGLKNTKQHKDFAGFKRYDMNSSKWLGEIGLLNGISGIGLVLMSYLFGLEYDWDESLLIS